MRYYDLIPSKCKGISPNYKLKDLAVNKCLAWSKHYETAVFALLDTIDPNTKHVWFELDLEQLYGARNYIIVVKVYEGVYTEYEDKTPYYPGSIVYKSELVQEGYGNVPFKNEVVFTKHPKCMHTASAAGNTAEAVFPQNMGVRNTGKQMFVENLIRKRFGMYYYGLGVNDE